MSYTNLNYHILFSTKERRPWLNVEIMSRLVPYLGGIVRDEGGAMLKANGPADHAHIVAILPPTIALSDFLRVIKAASSGWIHRTFKDLKGFDWQDGYAAFSVSKSALQRVLDYVSGQNEHHRKMTFKEELITLLKRHGIEYDERYLV